MSFFTRLPLEDRQVKQETGSTLTLSGETNFVGTLKSKGIEIDASISGTSIGDILTWDGSKIKLEASPTFSGGSVIYSGATPSTVTVGGISAGTVLTGKTFNDLWEELLVPYVSPAFTSFSVSGQANTVEVGTTLSGSKTFTWAISTGANVQPNTNAIYDITNTSYLATSIPNSGSYNAPINTEQLNSNGATQQWRGEADNTQSSTFQSSIFTVTGRFYRFYGPNATTPTTSANVRALPSSAFQTSNGMTFILNTGAVLTKFVVALPPGRTINEVIDIDALNANITSQYILQGTVSVQDAGGTGRLYNIYEMNLGSPYSSNHRHEITTQ